MWCVPLEALDRGSLPVAGGKASNLGELIRAGAPVPPGFCVTTAAYDLIAPGGADSPAEARDRILRAQVPAEVAEAIRASLAELGEDTPVAVRSSATAEDLPSASFAGQQETYLDVVGPDAVLAATRRCWASLFTDRGVAYRAAAGVEPAGVRLAVVVQRMVPAQVAGILFTANPVTGCRTQAVVDASPGLGEAIVSGAVNPDHFVLDAATGTVLSRQLGDRRRVILPAGARQLPLASGAGCLTDAQLRELAAMGTRLQVHFGSPQDVEFAYDGAGRLWIVQARPITTLFPLPAQAAAGLRVYWCLSVMQGVLQPMTPMGVQAFRLVAAAFAGLVGTPPAEPLAGPPALRVAAGRLFLDITPLLALPIGRALDQVEAESGRLVRALQTDPRLRTRRTAIAPLLRAVRRTRLPLLVAAALRDPAAPRRDAARMREQIDADAEAGRGVPLDAAQEMLLKWPPRLIRLFAGALAGLAALALGERLAGGCAGDVLRRGLPHNPTTEMDLALWDLACAVRSDPAALEALRASAPGELAAAYGAGTLPPPLGEGLAGFLARYGHRGVAEIDLGLPRWSENPAPVLASLANYALRWDPARAPDAQFRAGAAAAEAACAALGRRGPLVRFLLHRGRQLAGLRELPKFTVVHLLARVRGLLLDVGRGLAAAGRLAGPEDVFFLELAEVRAALAGLDQRELVRARRDEYARECRRRHVPRLMLSDGTEVEAAFPVPAAPGALRGTPASAGQAEGRARVILDPAGAALEAGDILVAPSTDPGWTPLFLTAAGLVMEMGGPMSHGAVVAREYGIPAVVGCTGATRRIPDGERVRVDGTAGTVTVGD